MQHRVDSILNAQFMQLCAGGLLGIKRNVKSGKKVKK